MEVSLAYDPYENPKQVLFHECDADEVLYGGAKGGGKLLDINTIIPTPSGWTTMEKILPGDMVLGEDGEPVVVLARTAVVNDAKCYRLTFDDGTQVVACADHLWKTYTANDLCRLVHRSDEWRARRRAKRPSRSKGKRPDVALKNTINTPPTLPPPTGDISTTQEIVDTFTVKHGVVLKNHAVMNTSALELPEQRLPLDPYILGAWLGDGTTKAGAITTADEEMLQEFLAAGFKTNYHQRYTYGVPGLVTKLREIGVFGNKHIPMVYKRASKEQRLSLLQGLMDTDGYARKHGGCEYTTVLPELATDFKELVVSLGWKACIREGLAKLNGRVTGPKYRVVFTPDEYVFRLPRKKEAQSLSTSYVQRAKHRFIVAYEEVPSVPMRCIQVSGNGMYLCTESMIPTHNSCALVMDCFAYGMTYKGAVCYLFRETFDELEANLITEWKAKIPQELYKYHESKHIATLINGTKVYFRFCDCVEDAAKYDGRSIDYIGVDELTKHLQEEIQILLSCLRSPRGYPPRFRATSNPGQKGHKWCKKRYVDPTRKGARMYRDKKNGNSIAYIPATVYDNKILMQNDPAYVKRLENLPPAKKKALLHGDWDAYEGQAFEEFDKNVHVIRPFVIPDHWRRWITCDNGYADPFAWYWFAVDEDGFVYIYREYTRKRDDEKIFYSDQARRAVELSTFTRWEPVARQDETLVEIWDFIVAGHDAWSTHHRDVEGKTLIDYYEEGGLHSFIRGDTDRKIRKGTWHEYLRPFKIIDPESGEEIVTARLRIFDTCRYLITSIPQLQEDEMDADKVSDAAGSDNHGYDSAGMGLVAYHAELSRAPEKEKTKMQKYKEKLARQGQYDDMHARALNS